MNLTLNNISVEVNGRSILQDINLEIRPGEIHALMGPNASGKSSLALAIAGHPEYKVSRGEIRLGKTSILEKTPEERSHEGVFISFQEPPEIGGVELGIFLKKLIARGEENKRQRIFKMQFLKEVAHEIGVKENFLSRFLNKDFSGGEKKKSEILQLLALEPRFVILDEIEAGLDRDSFEVVTKILNHLRSEKKVGMLLISHNTKLFHQLVPNYVHVLQHGTIGKTGNKELLKRIDEKGFQNSIFV